MKSKEGSSRLAEELSLWPNGLVNDVSPALPIQILVPGGRYDGTPRPVDVASHANVPSARGVNLGYDVLGSLDIALDIIFRHRKRQSELASMNGKVTTGSHF